MKVDRNYLHSLRDRELIFRIAYRMQLDAEDIHKVEDTHQAALAKHTLQRPEV